jgi:hypothetical protein
MRGTEWHAVNYDDKTVAGRDRSHVDMTESMYMVMKCNVIGSPTLPSTKYQEQVIMR